MATIKETTVHDMKTNFSRYASALLDGTYDEIVVKNRTTPTLRVLPYRKPTGRILRFGMSKSRGHAVVGQDWDMHEGDAEIADMFAEELS